MPNQQNPEGSRIESVLNNKTFSNNDKFTIGVGGQSVFNTSKEIGASVAVFEGGVMTSKAVNVTGENEVTTDLIPEGTIVNILY